MHLNLAENPAPAMEKSDVSSTIIWSPGDATASGISVPLAASSVYASGFDPRAPGFQTEYTVTKSKFSSVSKLVNSICALARVCPTVSLESRHGPNFHRHAGVPVVPRPGPYGPELTSI